MISRNQARINRAAFASVAALSLTACRNEAIRRDDFARACMQQGNAPSDCVDAAERMYHTDNPPTNKRKWIKL